MIREVKVIMDGQSQEVRLPRALRSVPQPAYIRKTESVVTLIPIDNPWHNPIKARDEFTDDFMDN